MTFMAREVECAKLQRVRFMVCEVKCVELRVCEVDGV